MNRSLLCGVGSAMCLVAGLSAILAFNQYTRTCTARDASGRRIVIGTELTEAGLRYKRENPADNNDAILEALPGHGPEVAWTAESIARCNFKLTASAITRTAAFPLALLFAAIAFFTRARSASVAPKRGTVFLSYTHADADVTMKLRRALAEHSLRVLVDSESMSPGERIHDFIERCLRESETVISVVSSRSLLSAWVALETVQTLERNKWMSSRKWIACYLDDTFFDPECRLILTRQIDDRLHEIESLLVEHAARRIDSRDLDDEKTRLYDLRNNLGVILSTLKSSLCLDLRPARFDESVQRLVSAIRSR